MQLIGFKTVGASPVVRRKYRILATIALASLALAMRAHVSFLPTAAAQATSRPASQSLAQSPSVPLILFTDVVSGPNSGGEGNNGTYLTIFGAHFGATQGASTVTINGRPVAQYLLWSNTKIGVQVGRVSSGPIVVSVGGAVSNSDKTFTVRSGRIFYIGPTADNSPASCAGGTYAQPWGLTNFASKNEADYTRKMRTPTFYYECISLGDTLVFLDGASYPYFDGHGWHSSFTPSKQGATATNYVTIMARPGAKAQLGGVGWIMAPVRDISNGYNVYSGLTLTGSGVNGGANFSPGGGAVSDRVVGNDISCPDCWGPAGAVMGCNGLILYGNVIHDVATLNAGGSNKQYHAAYVFGNNLDVAWNRIYNAKAYNGIQIHHDGFPGFYNISIHDNDIADVNGSGINLSAVDPSSGYVKVFNNIIHHVGLNSASDGSGGDPHSCIAVKGYGTATAPGTIQIYNNTMYDCSSYLNVNPASNVSCAILILAHQLNVTTNLVNNIVYQPSYAGTTRQSVYICGGDKVGTISGSNNLWYSDSRPGRTAPANNYGTIANPLFLSPTDFHLRSQSPALHAGAPIDGLIRDRDGLPRKPVPTIGAYE